VPFSHVGSRWKIQDRRQKYRKYTLKNTENIR